MNRSDKAYRKAGALILVLALSALPALGQQDDLDALIERGTAAGIDRALLQAVDTRATERGLDPEQRMTILSKGIELAEQDLPADAVLQKALEGVAKQVPLPRVISVLDRMQQQTVRAGGIVDTWLDRPEAERIIVEARSGDSRGRAVLVKNTAEALVHDVPRSTIDAVLDQLPAQARRSEYRAADVGTALGVLADLSTSRSDAEATADLLVSALNAGFSQAEIRQLPLAIKMAEQRGGSPADIARSVTGEISRGNPAQEVLRDLFGGDFPGEGAGVGGRGAGEGGPPSSAGPPPGVGPGDVGDHPGRGNDNNSGRGRDN